MRYFLYEVINGVVTLLVESDHYDVLLGLIGKRQWMEDSEGTYYLPEEVARLKVT